MAQGARRFADGSTSCCAIASQEQPQKTVLLVDDDKAILTVVGRLLARNDYQVTEANDPYQAMALLQEATRTGTPYGLVLSDVRMPRMDGTELMHAARAQGYDGPFLFMSGYTNLADVPTGMLINKPFGVDELLGKVAESAQSRTK